MRYDVLGQVVADSTLDLVASAQVHFRWTTCVALGCEGGQSRLEDAGFAQNGDQLRLNREGNVDLCLRRMDGHEVKLGREVAP